MNLAVERAPEKKKLITVEPRELNQRIDEIFYSHVKALSFALALLFFIFSLAHLVFYKTNTLTTLQTIMSFLILFAIMNLIMTLKINPKYSHFLATIIVTVVLLNSIQYIKFTDDLIYIIYIMLIIIGCGVFFLSFTWYFLSMLIILGTVGYSLILHDYAESWKVITATTLFSFYVSFLANYLKIKSTRNFQMLYMLSHKHELVLQKTMDKLESINTELKDFAYIISHDLKAPLRGINSLAGWFIADYGDKFDESGKEQLQLLMSRVKRMDQLIDGVLEYSRIGRISEEHIDIDLAVSVPAIIDLIAPPARIKFKVLNRLPKVYLERTRIEQVFQNLFSNAIKYIDKAEGLVEIGCTEAGDFWQFSVADNGPGIAEKDYEKVFKIFQMLQSRDTNDSTGIGLTIVKKIIEMYGGRIWISSEMGKGTTFFFTLPKTETKKHR